ncbi:MAG: WYL domain-containing protein [Owenweeksia sp.]|nr:WYL domain-containing protein [Owenweeksia sp.]
MRKLNSKNYPNWKEIQDYVERELEILSLQDESIEPNYSKRTFDRDKADFRETFGISIRYTASQRGYYIEEDAYHNQGFERILEAFDIFNALRLSQDVWPFIHLEQRRPQGTENLYGLLHAIKNKLEIRFTYHKFWEEEKSLRHVAPYGLKEYRNRWYVLAKDFKDDQLKTFGLDRLSELQMTNRKMDTSKPVDVEEYFRYCFGVIQWHEEPEEIELAFTAFQGKYIKTLPLHSTQEILEDSKKQLRVKLKLHITYDFTMELLSYGSDVMVIAPKRLKKDLQERHKLASLGRLQ